MKNLILIILAVFAFSTTSVTTRFFQLNIQKKAYSINLFQASYCLVAAICYFTVSSGAFSTQLMLPSMIFGCCFACASLFSAKCMQLGYMSVSSIITNLSMILPVAFSWIVLGEAVKLNSVIGLLLIIAALVLSSLSTKKDSGTDLKKWLLFVSIAFFANGGSAIVQKQYKSAYSSGDIMLFMSLAYFTSAVIFASVYLCRYSNDKAPFAEQIKGNPLMLLIAVIAGFGSFGGNGILGILCDKINGGVLYPCINGGLSITVAICSFVFFKEKLTKTKLTAIAIGLTAIILLNI